MHLNPSSGALQYELDTAKKRRFVFFHPDYTVGTESNRFGAFASVRGLYRRSGISPALKIAIQLFRSAFALRFLYYKHGARKLQALFFAILPRDNSPFTSRGARAIIVTNRYQFCNYFQEAAYVLAKPCITRPWPPRRRLPDDRFLVDQDGRIDRPLLGLIGYLYRQTAAPSSRRTGPGQSPGLLELVVAVEDLRAVSRMRTCCILTGSAWTVQPKARQNATRSSLLLACKLSAGAVRVRLSAGADEDRRGDQYPLRSAARQAISFIEFAVRMTMAKPPLLKSIGIHSCYTLCLFEAEYAKGQLCKKIRRLFSIQGAAVQRLDGWA